MRWCEWKKENQSDRNQTAETTKALRFTHGHFIHGKHPRAQAHAFSDTLSLIIIPPIFPYHSITINSSPSSYNLFFSTPPPVSFPLRSIYHFTSRPSSLLPISPHMPLFPPHPFLAPCHPSPCSLFILALPYSFAFIPHVVLFSPPVLTLHIHLCNR